MTCEKHDPYKRRDGSWMCKECGTVTSPPPKTPPKQTPAYVYGPYGPIR